MLHLILIELSGISEITQIYHPSVNPVGYIFMLTGARKFDRNGVSFSSQSLSSKSSFKASLGYIVRPCPKKSLLCS
jgi:hypothetical protein